MNCIAVCLEISLLFEFLSAFGALEAKMLAVHKLVLRQCRSTSKYFSTLIALEYWTDFRRHFVSIYYGHWNQFLWNIIVYWAV